MATMKVHATRIDISRVHETPEGDHLVDGTVHLTVESDLGNLEFAVPVENSHGTDHAIDDARRRLQEWSKRLTNSALVRHAELYKE